MQHDDGLLVILRTLTWLKLGTVRFPLQNDRKLVLFAGFANIPPGRWLVVH